MKKVIISSALILSMTVLVFNRQISEFIWPEVPVTKEVSLAITADNSYQLAAYENSKATVHVSIYKITKGKQTLLWEKDFDTLLLKDYPDNGQAIRQDIKIPKVYEKREDLVITYKVTYNCKGNIVQLSNGSFIPEGKTIDHLTIKI